MLASLAGLVRISLDSSRHIYLRTLKELLNGPTAEVCQHTAGTREWWCWASKNKFFSSPHLGSCGSVVQWWMLCEPIHIYTYIEDLKRVSDTTSLPRVWLGPRFRPVEELCVTFWKCVISMVVLVRKLSLNLCISASTVSCFGSITAGHTQTHKHMRLDLSLYCITM